jgi:membrane protein DedA with SNARE-associated domain
VDLSFHIPAAVWQAIGLIYIEESGIPLPAPGDTFLIYAGHNVGRNWAGLAFAWLALTLAVTAGASNLYVVSRLVGPRLARGRVGAVLHLNEQRLERAEQAFKRWGPLALIFGRHVFGLRIPITVASGVLRVPYALFAVCIAISSAVWVGFYLAMGVIFGQAILSLINRYKTWAYLLVAVVVVVFVVYFVIRWRAASRKAS